MLNLFKDGIILRNGRRDKHYIKKITCPYCDCMFLSNIDENSYSRFTTTGTVKFVLDNAEYSVEGSYFIETMNEKKCPWCHEKIYLDGHNTVIDVKRNKDHFRIKNPTEIQDCANIESKGWLFKKEVLNDVPEANN